MDFTQYKQHLKTVLVGKRLPDAIYIHESLIEALPSELRTLVESAAAQHASNLQWNVLKLYRQDFKISLLSYADFLNSPYPELRFSHVVNLARGSARTYPFSFTNPPILHRKETLLSVRHPLRETFEAVTKEAEAAGLYQDVKRIGYKGVWLKLVREGGYVISQTGHLTRIKSAKEEAKVQSVEVARHKTAIARGDLSAPMKIFETAGFLSGEYSVLDYGCGRGDDLLELETRGLDVTGWDPAHRPDGKLRKADVVNLGFVINVIEDQQERIEVLKAAYAHTDKVLAVSVMLGGESLISQFEPYRDGVMTKIGTFQKYFTQSELKTLIEETLCLPSVAAAPGIFLIFKDKSLEELFVLNRRSRPPRQKKLKLPGELIRRHAELFDAFYDLALELGRIPANNEFERSEELRRIIGSHAKAIALLTDSEAAQFEAAGKARREDLLVYFALRLFGQREVLKNMPNGLKRDVKTFFGRITEAQTEAKALLFSIADAKALEEACKCACSNLGAGVYEPGAGYTLHSKLLVDLPPLLRIYVGCAEVLIGETSEYDLTKIHLGSGKVTFLKFEDFTLDEPLLIERLKVNLATQSIDLFTYGERFPKEPLYNKARFIEKAA